MTNTMHENTEQLLNLTGDVEGNGEVEVIVKYNGDILKLEKEIGAHIELLDFNYAIITLMPNQVSELYNHTEVEYIELPKIVAFNLESDVFNSACVPTIQNSMYNLSGKGTITAIIDSGIDYTHSDFKNEDGTSKILFIWDQIGSGFPPDGFKNGTEYGPEQINRALNNSNPYDIVPRMDTNRAWYWGCWSISKYCAKCKYYSSKTWKERAGVICKDDGNYERSKICNR